MGVQPNSGALLKDGDILNVAPSELRFQFDAGQQINTNTLGAVQVTRSGGDDAFAAASVSSDFNTKGAVVINFAALQLGDAGNRVSIVVSKSNRGLAAPPLITVSGTQIVAELNSFSGSPTTAAGLVLAINADPLASQLVRATVTYGPSSTDITTPAITYSPLSLTGANAAFASTNFNTAVNLGVKFTAVQAGVAGNGISIAFGKVNRGGAGAPLIQVDSVNRKIQVQLNSYPGFETTASQLVSAFNASAAARALAVATLPVGDPNQNITTPTINYSPLVLAGANDVSVTAGYLAVDETGREIIFRFAEQLPQDLYRIDISGVGTTALRNQSGQALGDTTADNVDNGQDFSLQFRLNLGAQVLGVVPQPVYRTAAGTLAQLGSQIEVYFNNDPLDPKTAENPNFYQLIFTADTVTNADDMVYKPFLVQYDAASSRAILTFTAPLQQLGSGPGTFRLRIGTDETGFGTDALAPNTTQPQAPTLVPLTGQAIGDSFATSHDLGTLTGSEIISSAITSQVYTLTFPGGSDNPGQREIVPEVESPLLTTADSQNGIATVFYNFRKNYGVDPSGNALTNLITPDEEQRAREIFDLYAQQLGVQFVETTADGITIATGDLRAIDKTLVPGTATLSLTDAAQNLLVMNALDNWYDGLGNPATNNRISWFTTAFPEIGHLLGLGDAYDLPAGTVMAGPLPATAEPIYPGDQDVVNGQILYRPAGTDINLYKFQVTATATLSAETIAQRQTDASQLNTVLRLYREQSNGQRQLVSQNDDYFGTDSYLQATLEPGTYYIGVSASGNDSYDPTISGSGMGGLTEGKYNLQLTLRNDVGHSIMDRDGNPNPANANTTVGTALDGDGDGAPGGVYNYWFRAANRTIFVDKTAANGGTGSPSSPYNTISAALNAASSGDIVRIVANGGTDKNVGTPSDAAPYLIGRDSLSRALSDGTTLDVPKGVTVVVDPDVVIKLSGARIDVGSSSATTNRSGGTLQVLGTPRLVDLSTGVVLTDANGHVATGTVYFTSLNDETLGGDTTPSAVTVGQPGDWGGLVFRNDLDRAATPARFDAEQQGEFLNYVNGAELRYGGGIVYVDGIPQSIAPLDLTDARPTISFNTITHSADAAISANPDSFEETDYHAPQYQLVPFTPDYTRIGPDVHGNRLLDNSINGLFVRVQTPAGGQLETMNVAGRWHSSDIVYVVAENLQIAGNPGGPQQTATGPNVSGVTLQTRNAGISAVQRLVFGGSPLGKFTLTFGGNWTTSQITYNATPSILMANIQSALDSLLGVGNTAVGFVSATTYSITYTGNLATANLPPLTATNPSAGGTLTVSSVQSGTGNEVQTLALGGTAGGTVTLSYDGVPGTLATVLNIVPGTPVTATQVLAQLESIPALNRNVTVLGAAGGPFTVVFRNTLAFTDVWPLGQAATGDATATIATVANGSGGAVPAGVTNYKLTYVDSNGHESLASPATANITVAVTNAANNQTQSVMLNGLPAASAGYASRRLYRLVQTTADPVSGGVAAGTLVSPQYVLVANLDATTASYLDTGADLGTRLTATTGPLTARLSGRLVVDPGVVVKLNGAGIETSFGSQLIAEGSAGHEVIFTSLQDKRYGAGGTFATSKQAQDAAAEDWTGIYVGHVSRASFDHAVFAYGGGWSRTPGDFASYNTIEIHQADARITNSLFEHNGDGMGGQTTQSRAGLGQWPNASALIFVRGAQPVVVNNVMSKNAGPVININVNSLNADLLTDSGRSTGAVDRVADIVDNYGPLIRRNELANNGINGLLVRSATLTTQSIWDDTDIVHVVQDTITVPDFHTYGGLRLQSSANESLVVKLSGATAGFTATGTPLDITDRIGGTVQVLGLPGHPVVLTSMEDDTVGAGFQPDGTPQVDTDNKPAGSGGGSTLLPTQPDVPNGTLIDNDVAATIPGHFQIRPTAGGDSNWLTGSGVTAQGTSQLWQNASWIFRFTNYIDAGSDGNAIDLGATTVTMQPTLIGKDRVASEGSFTVGGQTVNWHVETYLTAGVATIFNTVTLTSTAALGNLRFINYLDEDVVSPGGDYLYTVGTPGQPDFRAYTIDNAERVGFSQGGIYQPGAQLVNATYTGWAADEYPMLQGSITTAGTNYSLAGNINTTNLPAYTDSQLGTVYGGAFGNDVTTAFAWNVNATATTATMTSFLDLVPRNPSVASGAWNGILLGQYSNDRNVDVAVEAEPGLTSGTDSDGVPAQAQYLGALAPNEASGDDNLRLGFEVHGSLNRPSDVDVYSFDAQAGTEVWLAVDRTTYALDTVVELVDASGNVLARSNDAAAEVLDPSLLDYNPAALTVNPVRKSPFLASDPWSTNPKDAGMRVVLPGPQGKTNPYYVRVRSNSSNLNNLAGGQTSGVYQLQVRLRETEEVPGSTVRMADIRYAATGITVSGLLAHSPLTGDAAEIVSAAGTDANNTPATADTLGNLLATDRGTLSVAGSLATAGDVDWYQFQVNYDNINPANAADPHYLSTVFDLDYADGYARADSNLWVFDSQGRLILAGRDSAVRDDQAAGAGTNTADLSRGSAGSADAYIGPVELPATGLPTGTYYVAVSSNALIPAELQQYLVSAPANPLLRLEPVDSVQRIAEDHVNSPGTTSTAVGPQLPILFGADNQVTLIAPAGSQAKDGETFTLTNAAGTSRTYEFDRDGNYDAGHIPISFQLTSTADEIGTTIAAAIKANPPASLAPTALATATPTADSPVVASTLAVSQVAGSGNLVTIGETFDRKTLLYNVITAGAGGKSVVTPHTRTTTNHQTAPVVSQHPANGQSAAVLKVSLPGTVPFDLNDLTLFVNQASPTTGSTLQAIDPFTGQQVAVVGPVGTNAIVGDIASHPDGRLIGSDNTGASYTIDPRLTPANLAGGAGGNADTALTFSNAEVGNNVLSVTAVANQVVTTGAVAANLGVLNTAVDAFPATSGTTAVTGVPATTVTPATGATAWNVEDGDYFQVDSNGDGNPDMTFEFDTGPEFYFDVNTQDLTNPQILQDGDSFKVDGVKFEFDTGSVLVVTAQNGNQVQDGGTFSIWDDKNNKVTFEFDSNQVTLPGNVPVSFAKTDAQQTIITSIVNAINLGAPSFDVQAAQLTTTNRISLLRESATTKAQVNGQGITISGAPGLTDPAAISIPIEETYTVTQLGQAMMQVIDGTQTGGFIAGAAGHRLNFMNATTASFSGVTNPVFGTTDLATGIHTGQAGAGSNIRVPFLASDDAAAIAADVDKVLAVRGFSVVLAGTSVALLPSTPQPTFIVTNLATPPAFGLRGKPDDPLPTGGGASGGNITGLAFVGAELYAITDVGGLFRLTNATGGAFNPTLPLLGDYVDGSRELLTSANVVTTTAVDPITQQTTITQTTLPIRFVGLSAGPSSTEDGRYENLLFGMDQGGRLFAFDTQGNPQAVFANGTTFVDAQLATGAGFVVTAQSGQQLQDGGTFTIWNAQNVKITFEFDNNGTTRLGNVSVPYTAADTQQTISTNIAAAINALSSTFGVQATRAANRITLQNQSSTVVPVVTGQGLTVLGGATGLAFSALDDNLWHATLRRSTDVGHGIDTTGAGTNPAFDNSRVPETSATNQSYYFGYEGQNVQGQFGTGNFAPAAGTVGTYDFTGGAHGSLLSNPFSLAGYAAGDAPTLYFNYFLATEDASDNANTALPNPSMRDSLRVYVAGDDGAWKLLATNNRDVVAGDSNDELDSFSATDPVSGNTVQQQPFATQQLFDTQAAGSAGTWRQARVDLSPYVGQGYLRLRFDFDTAGGASTGGRDASLDLNLAGNQLQAVAASQLHDGDQFTLTDPATNAVVATFEFDLGPSIVAPSGAAIVPGATFAVDGTTYEFNDAQSVGVTNGIPNIAIPFTGDETPSQLAAKIQQVLRDNPPAPEQLTGNLTTGEPNDTPLTATNSQLDGTSQVFTALGSIGDNSALADRSLDVDMVKLRLAAGDHVSIAAGSSTLGAQLDPYLRLFDAQGNEVAANDNASPSDPSNRDAQIDYTVAQAGLYYVGVSASHNSNYLPDVPGSGGVKGKTSSTGPYQLTIAVSNLSGPLLVDNRVNLPSAHQITLGTVAPMLPASFVEGGGGVGSGPAVYRIPVNLTMSNVQVAAAIQEALAEQLAGGTLSGVPRNQEVVTVMGYGIGSPGPLGISGASDPHAVGYSGMFGDQFSAVGTALGMKANQSEGVYLDDIIIGFAGRGEMATNSTATDAAVANRFVNNPAQTPNEINVGPYQLEIRQASPFGQVNSVISATTPRLVLTQAFAIDDRLTQGTSLVASPGVLVYDGQFFAISNGTNTVAFEFDDLAVADGVVPGRTAIAYNASDSAVVMARRIRDAINLPAVQQQLGITAMSGDGILSGTTSTSDRVDLSGSDGITVTEDSLSTSPLANAPATGGTTPFGNTAAQESNDTLRTAVPTGMVAGGRGGFRALGTIGDNSTLLNPNADADLFRVELEQGEIITVSLAAASLGSTLDGYLRVFDASGPLAVPTTAETSGDPSLVFTAPAAGVYYIGVSSSVNNQYAPTVIDPNTDSQRRSGRTGSYQLTILRPLTGEAVTPILYDAQGDANLFRDQGQIIISDNRITNSSQFGIAVTAGTRGTSGNPSLGAPRNLSQVNTSRLAPGVTITDNILAGNSAGGIDFHGDPIAAGQGQQLGVVPFGRIINNTIVGSASGSTAGAAGIGIRVSDNAGPTLLNNIAAGLVTGVSVLDAASVANTVIGGMLYQGNTNNGNLAGTLYGPTKTVGTFDLALLATQTLFVQGTFYPAPNSPAIDSSINALDDREAMLQLRTPLGISASPILAPTQDAVGQQRVDDTHVPPPTGMGENVFKDRGAVEAADVTGPKIALGQPLDNGLVDLDPTATIVNLLNTSLDQFTIQLGDGNGPAGGGSGINDSTVTADAVSVLRGSQTLVEGVDYRFDYDATSNIIRLTPLAGLWDPSSNYTIQFLTAQGTVLKMVSGADLKDGDTFRVQDQSFSPEVTFEYETGYVLQMPQTLAIQIPLAGGGAQGVADGDTIVVSKGTTKLTLELDSNGVFTAGNVQVQFTANSSQGEIADAIVAALKKNTTLGLVPVNAGAGLIQLGGDGTQTVSVTSATITVLPGAVVSGVLDGQKFSIDDGTKLVTFEFDTNQRVGTGNVAVPFSLSYTPAQLAAAVLQTINASTLGVQTKDLGKGAVQVVGVRADSYYVLDATAVPAIVVTGQAGVRSAFGIKIPTTGAAVATSLADGQTFQILHGTTAVTFEFDSNGRSTLGNTVISFTKTTTPDDLANLLVGKIRDAGLGLSPFNAGFGRILLGGDATYSLKLTTSALQQLGQPGVAAAVPVFVPDKTITAQQLAQTTAAAINAATASGAMVGVQAAAQDVQVVITGGTVTGTTLAQSQPITDVAGNPLQANQPDGSARLTILNGERLDFGDAPDPKYPTLLASNGARHRVIPGFSLGPTVVPDADGNPSGSTVTADNDGVTFDTTLIKQSAFQVTVQLQGVGSVEAFGILDAWIDFDGSGTWETSEQILTSVKLTPADLANDTYTFTAQVPATAKAATTWARFRISTTTGLLATGYADAGEVEDYQITILGSVWQNPTNQYDVNGNGIVSPIDVLLEINYVNAHPVTSPPQKLPAPGPNEPPPYLDVDGDGYATASDVLLIVNAINSQNNAGGEGESGILVSAANGGSVASLAQGSQVAAPAAASLAGGRAASSVTTPVSVNGNTAIGYGGASAFVGMPKSQQTDLTLPSTSPSKSNHLDDILDHDLDWSGIAEDVDSALQKEDVRDALFASLGA